MPHVHTAKNGSSITAMVQRMRRRSPHPRPGEQQLHALFIDASSLQSHPRLWTYEHILQQGRKGQSRWCSSHRNRNKIAEYLVAGAERIMALVSAMLCCLAVIVVISSASASPSVSRSAWVSVSADELKNQYRIIFDIVNNNNSDARYYCNWDDDEEYYKNARSSPGSHQPPPLRPLLLLPDHQQCLLQLVDRINDRVDNGMLLGGAADHPEEGEIIDAIQQATLLVSPPSFRQQKQEQEQEDKKEQRDRILLGSEERFVEQSSSMSIVEILLDFNEQQQQQQQNGIDIESITNDNASNAATPNSEQQQHQQYQQHQQH